MFCPQCKAEYRPGFTRRNDCDVDLVDELTEPPAAAEPLSDADLQVAWTGNDEGEGASICERFDEAGIPFKVVQQTEGFFFGGASERFEIRVPANRLDEARTMAQEIAQEMGERQELAEEGEDEDATEPLDAAENAAAPFDDAPDQGRDWDPRSWHPEDATEEVWTGEDPRQAEMVELSLREHHIHARTDTLDDGSRQVFVMPEQDARAREIVREIVDGAPRQ